MRSLRQKEEWNALTVLVTVHHCKHIAVAVTMSHTVQAVKLVFEIVTFLHIEVLLYTQMHILSVFNNYVKADIFWNNFPLKSNVYKTLHVL